MKMSQMGKNLLKGKEGHTWHFRERMGFYTCETKWAFVWLIISLSLSSFYIFLHILCSLIFITNN